MDGLTGAEHGRLNFRWGRIASCLQRLLAPEFSRDEMAALGKLVIPTNDRFEGSPLLPPTRFSTEVQANALWERAAIELMERKVGPVEIRTDIDGIFEELALNAAQHSRSPGNYAMLEVDGAQRQRTLRQTGRKSFIRRGCRMTASAFRLLCGIIPCMPTSPATRMTFCGLPNWMLPELRSSAGRVCTMLWNGCGLIGASW